MLVDLDISGFRLCRLLEPRDRLIERPAPHQLELPFVLRLLRSAHGERAGEGVGRLALPAEFAVELAEPQPVRLARAVRPRGLTGERKRRLPLTALAEQADARIACGEGQGIA